MNVQAPPPHTIRESKALILLGSLSGVLAISTIYIALAIDLTTSTRVLLASCVLVLVVCAAFFFLMYFNYYVKVTGHGTEHRSMFRKVTSIPYTDINSYKVVKLGKVPMLRVYGPEGEVINLNSQAYNVTEMVAFLDSLDGNVSGPSTDEI